MISLQPRMNPCKGKIHNIHIDFNSLNGKAGLLRSFLLLIHSCSTNQIADNDESSGARGSDYPEPIAIVTPFEQLVIIWGACRSVSKPSNSCRCYTSPSDIRYTAMQILRWPSKRNMTEQQLTKPTKMLRTQLTRNWQIATP